ncbi:DUF4013 domain-containing protein [Haloplanus litoreus]|uniref:DUF4013 domain-containing protein n=1 Tax=Haloplanus litoreus TaxID=767515 RepID=A0ABD5ZX59_9EURY
MAIDLERLVRYPANDDDWVRTLLVGGLLTALSVLIVPAFLLYGYLLRVLREGMVEGEEPPGFDDWGVLLRDGVVAFLIVLVYQFVPLLVAALTVGGSVLAILTGSDVGVGVGLFGLLAGLALSAVLALIFGYVTLIGVANYAHEGEVGAAFDTTVLRAVALDGAYAVPWLYGVSLLLVANVVAGLLGFVPVVGVFVVFYAQVAAAWIWGKGFADAMGLDDGAAEGTPAAVV